MSNIHIALVGGQPMPIYQCIEACNPRPDKIILIHSEAALDDKKNESFQIAQTINSNYKNSELLLLDTNNYDIFRKAIINLLNRYQDRTDNITVNLSGGPNQWKIVFALISKNYRNVSLISLGQNNIIYNYSLETQESINHYFTIDTLLKYNDRSMNYHTPKHTLLSSYNDDDREDMEKLDSIWRSKDYYYGAFKSLTTDWKKEELKKLLNGEPFTSNKGDKITGDIQYDVDHKILTLRLLNHKTSKYDKYTFASEHSVKLVINSGWFEYKNALILAEWEKVASKDIWLNTHFDLADDNNEENDDEQSNEIDIIISTGTKLIFIECKTHIFKPTDIDKFSTAVRNYGGLGCKSIFITYTNMSKLALSKCGKRIVPLSLAINSQNNSFKTIADFKKELFARLDTFDKESNER